MTNATYIPLDAKESAFLEDSNTLLPKAIYKRVAEFIRDAIRTQPAHKVSMNESRSHHAISIDGERGTGKTSVLVNLKRYVELEHPDLLADIHILNPVDPTLLEDGESLFLHMIVAAVLQDRQVQEAQRLRPEQARELQQCLERLGQGLESAELQVDRHGMDKIRALYGNRLLADSVQDFFRAALKLLDKKLLVLPIDDVDTSLNRAFENLEIIRRYLATPYVLTIVSGDRSLYNQVTWRDFHGRLTKDSAHLVDDAYGTALDLANEYQRKILPLPRRLTMPAVSQYWQDRDITLGKDGMPLANFITWLEIFIAGPVNGLEASRLALPISSIRALTQLINHCGELIPELPEGIRSAESDLQVRRRWQMPTVPQGVLEDFHKKHQELGKEKKREYATAYRLFSEELARQTPANYFLNDKLALKWVQQLTDYFRFEPQAGGVYLALLATNHWQSWAAGNSEVRRGGVFDTPLFQPLLHTETEFKQFDKQDDLSDWTRQLQNRLPESWLAKLEDQHTLLPYPAAELGINTTISWKYWDDIEVQIQDVEKQGNALFLLSLLMQHNFYLITHD